MLRWKHVEVSGGFLLLAALLYYLDGDGLLLLALAACALHELGHFCAIWLLGGRVALLRLTCVGAEMRLSALRPLRGWRQIPAALAGPGANLLAACVSARLAPHGGEWGYVFAGLNLALAAFNLLPADPLDGGRVLWQLLALLRSEEAARRALRVTTVSLALALLLGGGLLAWRGTANLTLIVTALWLLRPAVRAGQEGGTLKLPVV